MNFTWHVNTERLHATLHQMMQETAAQVAAWRETSARELGELDAALARLTEVRDGVRVVISATWHIGLS